MQKLFQATLVVFLVMVSIAVLAMVITMLMSMLAPQMMAESGGISAGVGGITSDAATWIHDRCRVAGDCRFLSLRSSPQISSLIRADGLCVTS